MLHGWIYYSMKWGQNQSLFARWGLPEVFKFYFCALSSSDSKKFISPPWLLSEMCPLNVHFHRAVLLKLQAGVSCELPGKRAPLQTQQGRWKCLGWLWLCGTGCPCSTIPAAAIPGSTARDALCSGAPLSFLPCPDEQEESLQALEEHLQPNPFAISLGAQQNSDQQEGQLMLQSALPARPVPSKSDRTRDFKLQESRFRVQ